MFRNKKDALRCASKMVKLMQTRGWKADAHQVTEKQWQPRIQRGLLQIYMTPTNGYLPMLVLASGTKILVGDQFSDPNLAEQAQIRRAVETAMEIFSGLYGEAEHGK